MVPLLLILHRQHIYCPLVQQEIYPCLGFPMEQPAGVLNWQPLDLESHTLTTTPEETPRLICDPEQNQYISQLDNQDIALTHVPQCIGCFNQHVCG